VKKTYKYNLFCYLINNKTKTMNKRLEKIGQSIFVKTVMMLFLFYTSACFCQNPCYETAVLPNNSVWGGGDMVSSVLIGNTYNAGQGPGIYIVADGGYRLYLNGELLAYDNAAGRVRFIPMTFLPNKNAISIVGINGSGAPGVLMHLDELSDSYVTNTQWKENNAPTNSAWKTKYYSDLNWPVASIISIGNLTQTPSGFAFSGFPKNSNAQWIWSGNTSDRNVILRYTFSINAVGFGAATTGGDSGLVVVANTTQQIIQYMQRREPLTILVPEGTYDFRKLRNDANGTWPWCTRHCYSTDANPNNNFTIVATSGICPSGETIAMNVPRWETLIYSKANKSLIGMGRGAKLRAPSFFIRGDADTASNIIFRNLAVYDMDPNLTQALDAFAAQSSNRLWIDHASIKWVSRGFMLAGNTGMKQVSLSYIHYDGTNPYSCQGNDPFVSLFYDSDVTLSHNYWRNTCGRVPKTLANFRTMQVHVLNSYVDSNTFFVAEAEGKSAKIQSQILFENNLVHNATGWPTIKAPYGLINSKNNIWTGKTGTFMLMDSLGAVSNSVEPHDNVFTPTYPYSLENVSTLNTLLPHNAGIGGKFGTMPLYTDVAGFANTAPVVSIIAPANGSYFVSPATVTLTASATDANGSIAKVEFYNGTTLIGTASATPFSMPVSLSTICTYSIVAIAYDNAGLQTISAPVVFQVGTSCTSTISTSGATTFCQGSNVTLTASTGAFYAWYNGTTQVGTSATYIASVSGSYTVQVTNAQGCPAISPAVSVTVIAQPHITISSPQNNATVNSSSVVLTTNVSGSGISGVTFYKGNSYLGIVKNSPYSYTVSNLANGPYVFYAVAQGTGNCTNTAAVNVTIANVITNVLIVPGSSEKQFLCYPNPFQDSFTIKAFGEFNYSITDMTGNELYKGKGIDYETTGANLDPGLYFVKIQNQYEIKVIKVTKY
jgi:hypothetical protein